MFEFRQTDTQFSLVCFGKNKRVIKPI